MLETVQFIFTYFENGWHLATLFFLIIFWRANYGHS